jgi:hypothetical protein
MRFEAIYKKNSVFGRWVLLHRASIVWNLLTPDLAKTSNVKNYTRMATKSKSLLNLDFGAESPQTMTHNNDCFIYY